MKRSTRYIKKALVTFLVVLMSIESFGAVVSDNDGSAFITKAEFDSLKNDFQSQIDQYNTSLDAKIDGAISSYLSGIQVAKKTKYAVEIADWKEITLLSDALEQTWKWPNLNIAFSYAVNLVSNQKQWYETWWARAGITYNRADNDYQKRNCVNAGLESKTNTAPDNVVWIGRSRNYVDGLNANQIGNPNVYLGGATYAGSALLVTDSLKFGTGYLPTLTLYNKWQGGLAWWNGQASPPAITNFMNSNSSGSSWVNANISSTINIPMVDGEQYDFPHILTFNDDSWPSLSDPNWSNTLNDNPSFSQEDVLKSTAVTKAGDFRVFEMMDSHYNNTTSTIDDWQTGQHSYTDSKHILYSLPGGNFKSYNSGHGHDVTSTAKMKSVGVLNKTYTSADIYQWAGKRKSKRDDNVEVEKTNLYNGALIAYAKSEESFAWEPKITGTYKSGTTDVAIRKWRVKLSDKPFGTGDSLGVGGKVLKNVGQTNDYLVTDDSGKCKFNIELGENTTIWCKWWPDDTNICNNYDWQGTLDLTQCGTYTITES